MLACTRHIDGWTENTGGEQHTNDTETAGGERNILLVQICLHAHELPHHLP